MLCKRPTHICIPSHNFIIQFQIPNFTLLFTVATFINFKSSYRYSEKATEFCEISKILWPSQNIWTLKTFIQRDTSILDPILLCCSGVKFIYSEKATKFCEISALLLSYAEPVKSKVEILQNFVASGYMNFA